MNMWAKVGESVIWENKKEKLLGLIIDNKLKFNDHVALLCKKAGRKITALSRRSYLDLLIYNLSKKGPY